MRLQTRLKKNCWYVHSAIGLGSNLLIHLNKSTAVVDKHSITATVLNVDTKHKHNLLRISQWPENTHRQIRVSVNQQLSYQPLPWSLASTVVFMSWFQNPAFSTDTTWTMQLLHVWSHSMKLNPTSVRDLSATSSFCSQLKTKLFCRVWHEPACLWHFFAIRTDKQRILNWYYCFYSTSSTFCLTTG